MHVNYRRKSRRNHRAEKSRNGRGKKYDIRIEHRRERHFISCYLHVFSSDPPLYVQPDVIFNRS